MLTLICSSGWQIASWCWYLGQQYGYSEGQTDPPEEPEGLADGDGDEDQDEGAGEDVAPELAVGEEDDEVGEEEDLPDGREDLAVLTEGIPPDPVESQPIDQPDQLGQQGAQLEPVHSLLPVDPGHLGHLGQEGGGDHQVAQEGRDLGDHHSVTGTSEGWGGIIYKHSHRR